MKAFIASLLFLALLGIRDPASFAQQNQNYQKLVQEIEALKTELSAVQSQLQTVENVEKIELMAKLADANAKLMNTEFGKFERDLRDSNDGWLMKWNGFFIGVLAVIGVALWFSVKSLIANRVEQSLSGFKEGLAQVDTLKNEFKEQIDILKKKIRALDKEHAAAVIERFMYWHLDNEDSHPIQIKELQEEALLDVFRDKTRHPDITERTALILAHRGSAQLASPTFEILNSTLDSHQDKELELDTASNLRSFVSLLSWTPTQETYEGLIKFLNRSLLRENKEFKDMLLTATILSIVWVSRELNKEDWLSPLKTSISQLDNEPDTIKKILQRRLLDDIPNVDDFEDYLLDLLEKHDTEFVNNFREQKANTNTETAAN